MQYTENDLRILEQRAAELAKGWNVDSDIVFAAITDWRSFPQWRKELKEVRPGSGAGGRESWIEISSMGELPLEIVESDPPRRLVGRIADPEHKLPFGGTWTYVITSDGDGGGDSDGCTLTITEDGEIRPPFFRFMARFIFGYAGTLEQYHRSLAKKFGEEPRFISR